MEECQSSKHISCSNIIVIRLTSPHTTSSKKENSSDSTINIKPNYAMDATTRQEHTVGVPLPLGSAFTVSLEMVN